MAHEPLSVDHLPMLFTLISFSVRSIESFNLSWGFLELPVVGPTAPVF